MKRVVFLITICLLLGAVQTFAQNSQYINYQAVARDASGDILESKPLVVELSILEGSVTGAIVWQEGHSVATNGFGLFTIKIGTGTPTGTGTLSSFDSIKWHLNDYFFSTRVDFGNGLVDMGTPRFLAVPYALYALTAGNSIGGTQKLSLSGHDLSITNGNTVTIPDNVDDADADPANEIQTISLSGTDLSISGGNTVSLPGDSDTDPTNEIQTLSVTGNDLSISGGNSITLPSSAWGKTNNILNYTGGNVAINTKANYHDSTLFTLTDSVTKNITALAFLYSIGSDNFFGSSTNFQANIEASNGTNSAIAGIANGNSGGINRGLFGFSESANSNYGVYGLASAGSKSTNHNYGVKGVSNGTTNGFNLGVFGEGNQSTGYNRGVDGRTAGTGSFNDGVFGESKGTGSGQNRGIYGFAQGSGFVNYGVIAETRGVGSWNIGVLADANGAAATNYALYSTAKNATTNYAAFLDGNVTYTGTLTGPSDAKLKEGVVNLSTALDMVNKLKPVTYTYKDSYREKISLSEGKQFGFIAQELELIIPELVNQQEAIVFGKDDYNQNAPIDKLEFKGINYIGLVPILTGAIQEQQLIIDQQQEAIDQLKLQNEQLLIKFEEIESRINALEKK